MVRKHDYAAQRRAPRVLGAESMPPGYERTPEFRAALRAQDAAVALRALPPGAPPGAALDGQPWAASWSEFLAVAAGRHPDSMEGRRFIRDAMRERVPSEGGFLVPWRLTETVLSVITPAIIRPRALPVAMNTAKVALPVLDNPSQASGAQALGGLTFAVVEDGKAVPSSAPSFGRLALEARKVAALISGVPNEVMADATPFTESFLPQVIARGLDWLIDDLCITNGTGTGQPQALVNSPAQVTVSRAASDAVVLADLVAMVKALHPAALKTATWLVSKSANDQILDLYYAATGQVWNGTELVNAQMPVAPPEWYTPGARGSGPSMLGLDAEVHDHGPAVGSTGDVMLADLGLYAFGALEWLTIEVAAKGSGFVSDTSSIRVRSRLDGRFWPTEPWTTQTSQSISPLVVLK